MVTPLHEGLKPWKIRGNKKGFRPKFTCLYYESTEADPRVGAAQIATY